MRVVDASVVVKACLGEAGLDELGPDLVAPPLLWSDTLSAIHELRWRGEVDDETTDLALSRLSDLPVRRMEPEDLAARAWQVADELGWAKTYDAEYVALAAMLGCSLVTIDARLARSAARLIPIDGPGAS